QGIALLQCAAVAAPERKEAGGGVTLFRVEQAPVEEAPPRLAAAADQGMAARVEGDRRQRRAELAQPGDAGAVQAPVPVLPRMPQAGLAAAFARFVPFGEDFQAVAAGPDQAVADAPAEAAAVGEQVDGFQQAGLARAVG